jgi:hypothetical protein
MPTFAGSDKLHQAWASASGVTIDQRLKVGAEHASRQVLHQLWDFAVCVVCPGRFDSSSSYQEGVRAIVVDRLLAHHREAERIRARCRETIGKLLELCDHSRRNGRFGLNAMLPERRWIFHAAGVKPAHLERVLMSNSERLEERGRDLLDGFFVLGNLKMTEPATQFVWAHPENLCRSLRRRVH